MLSKTMEREKDNCSRRELLCILDQNNQRNMCESFTSGRKFRGFFLLICCLAVHTLQGWVSSLGLQGSKHTQSSSVKFHSSVLYHTSHEQGHHCYWQHSKDRSRIRFEGTWSHLSCTSVFFLCAPLPRDISSPVSFSTVSPSFPHIQVHPIPSLHPAFCAQDLAA